MQDPAQPVGSRRDGPGGWSCLRAHNARTRTRTHVRARALARTCAHARMLTHARTRARLCAGRQVVPRVLEPADLLWQADERNPPKTRNPELLVRSAASRLRRQRLASATCAGPSPIRKRRQTCAFVLACARARARARLRVPTCLRACVPRRASTTSQKAATRAAAPTASTLRLAGYAPHRNLIQPEHERNTPTHARAQGRRCVMSRWGDVSLEALWPRVAPGYDSRTTLQRNAHIAPRWSLAHLGVATAGPGDGLRLARLRGLVAARAGTPVEFRSFEFVG
jgi:hypothetical protein